MTDNIPTTMRRKVHLLLFVLLISSNLSFGKISNKTKLIEGHKKSQAHSKTKPNIERIKRSIDDEDRRPFWANRGKKQSEEIYGIDTKYRTNNRILKTSDKEPPFWGNRGRRDSEENFIDDSYLPKHYNKPTLQPKQLYDWKERREEIGPFWGNRGRRTSDEVTDGDSPFWDDRGRKEEDEPFWGNRGRREEEPFWGNRGRRENELPYWGNRGRRSQLGNWVEDTEPFWGNRGRRKDQQNPIIDSFSGLEEKMENLRLQSEYEKAVVPQHSFWHQGRDSSLKHLFTAKPRYKYDFVHPNKKTTDATPKYDSRTLHDDRMIVEEPHYIIVERSSRSSGESLDPFYISRGKKKTHDLDLVQSARGRRARGAIEDIVKSVKNDPYFIVRGKKDGENDTKFDNSSAYYDKFAKATELICATIDMLLKKTRGSKVKREASESDRGRRAILKKLAEMAQMDPYFVSRGKKSEDRMYPNLTPQTPHAFVNQIADMCN